MAGSPSPNFPEFESLEREIKETTEKELGGRLFVSKKITRTFPSPEGKYVSSIQLTGAQGDCGCSSPVHELFICHLCRQVKCLNHVRTCSKCGHVSCVSCLVPVSVSESAFLICQQCYGDMNQTLLKQVWNWILGK